ILVFRRKYHLTVRRAVPVKPRPHLVKSDGASVLNLCYHFKPQPCYIKPHSESPTGSSTSQHSTSSLHYLYSFNT
ncbi:hypothetical protein BDR05DRAFT_966281, partial [Suillus weaverae]